MDDTYVIKLEEDVTSFSYYNKVLPLLHLYFTEDNRHKRLYFDMSEVNFVNPLVIPNFLILAVILKEHLKEPAELFIPWKPRLLSYLADIGFLDIVKRYGLFHIDEGYIGGFEANTLRSECKTFVFQHGAEEEDIYGSLSESNAIFRNIYKGSGDAITEKIDNLRRILTEVCKNGCSHSNSMCFATLQTTMSSRISFRKAYVAISDCGIGYYDSICRKILDYGYIPFLLDAEGFLSLKQKDERDIVAILEAILFRRDETIYGMFDVIKRVVSTNGVVRIHSQQTQLVFTQRNFLAYLDNVKLLLDDFKFKYEEAINTNLNAKYSNVRKSGSRFKGVHIEIEVPLS
jgi:hypothetical protein